PPDDDGSDLRRLPAGALRVARSGAGGGASRRDGRRIGPHAARSRGRFAVADCRARARFGNQVDADLRTQSHRDPRPRSDRRRADTQDAGAVPTGGGTVTARSAAWIAIAITVACARSVNGKESAMTGEGSGQ